MGKVIEYNTLLTEQNMVVKGNDYFSVVIKAMSPGSTGYSWTMPDFICDNVEFVSSQFIEYEKIPNYVGMPGIYLFTFHAVNYACAYAIPIKLVNACGNEQGEIVVNVKIVL